ncbi:pentapeptide repeat-containing protein [Nocardioides euryhalodurans]|uniref:Pentapeptide repeat-containing protein n=1 Tax=Nocardioides euryhalodurans TaxID=2518370 RepID=A0A4P7GN18_9ACTN|nr:pentapeptide repeat-containing protein [Nocardioides euryhalodurans]QBR93197.1 pentapeptide repeat-containing protein [Nocardioides euryhalodurans]
MREPELVADCSRCFGLCCVLLPFSRAGGFGADKDSGDPCHHLDPHDRCGIHDRLREDGWPGCTAFDCFGAGQHVSQVTYAGTSWREHDNLGEMAAVLSVVRQLHEMLAHLTEVQRRAPHAGAAAVREELLALTHTDPVTLLSADLDEVRSRVSPVLRDATRRLHGPGRPMPDDLAGADLRSKDLVRADLRGSLLIAADLRGVDLARADLLGADLRDADVRGARLADSWFLTQAQLNTTRGDLATTLPDHLARPAHWQA